MSAPALIQLERIEKSYGTPPRTQPVLRGVSLTVGAGDLVSLVGRSGSGKSTLLHVMGGLDRRYTGRALVHGVDLGALSDDDLAHLRNRDIGFVFQAFHLLDHLSCVENVALPHWFGGDVRDPLGRAREALDRVGIVELADKRPAELSGGQKQRVGIARALFHRPPLLLADEPTGNLDGETGQRIIELFGALNRDGLTLVVVTHEERVSQAARRVVRLDDGRIVDERDDDAGVPRPLTYEATHETSAPLEETPASPPEKASESDPESRAIARRTR